MRYVVDEIYKQRNDFIIIGLTGKIGSGCTTASGILSSTIEDIDLPSVSSDLAYTDNSRKRDIIYKHYIANWSSFTPIIVRDVITTFILQHEFCKVMQFLKESPDVTDALTIIKAEFEVFRRKNEHFMDCINRTYPDDMLYRYLFTELPQFSVKIKETLSIETYRNFSKAFQIIGDNIRRTGSAVGSAPKPDCIYSIAERIDKIIKVLSMYYKFKPNRKYFVIDAFRNPFEALYFRERHAPFYLFAIKSPERDRIDRLFHYYKLNAEQIKEQDNKEDSGKSPLDSRELFVSQNIANCIRLADIHINNIGGWENKDINHLKYQLIKYVSLIQHPGMNAPQRDEKLMQIAYTAKLNSGCISRQVGAVVTNKDKAIVAIGWNLRNMRHLVNSTDTTAYSAYEKSCDKFIESVKGKLKIIESYAEGKGRNLSFCFKSMHNAISDKKEQVQPRALHAEENAFLQIVKYGGEGVAGGTLYCTASPCELCSKKAYQLNISRIVYVEPYPGIATSHVIECGVLVPEIELFSGAIGPAYHKVYDPIINYKDEIDAIMMSLAEVAEEPGLFDNNNMISNDSLSDPVDGEC
jgi:dCMP deaminase